MGILQNVIAGIDLGSSRVGVARVDGAVPPYAPRGRTFDFAPCPNPEHVQLSRCGALCPHLHSEIARAVDFIAPLLVGAEQVVVEYQGWFPTSPGDIGRTVATQRTWSVGFALLMALVPRCASPMVGIARQTWAHRLVPHQRAIDDAMIAEALARELGAEASALRDAHQRDACGTILGWLRRPEVKPAKARPAPAGPRAKRSQKGRTRSTAWIERRSARRVEARAAIGCTCRWTRPQRDCPAWATYHEARQGISKGTAKA